MRYYIWDKQSNVAGVCATFLLELKPEFIDEPVIGIIDDFGIMLHFETMRSLQNKYKVWSNIPDVVGKEVIEKINKGYKLQRNGLLDGVDEASRIFLEAIMYDVKFDEEKNIIIANKQNNKVVKEAECKLTTVDSLNADEKSITVIIEGLNLIDSPLETVFNLKVMRRFKERHDILIDKIGLAVHEENQEDVDKYTQELTELSDSIVNMDFDLNIGAVSVYEYSTFILIITADGQTMIIDREIVASCRHNSLSYERTLESGDKGIVHFETIYIKLYDNVESELREFFDTVYISY